MVVVVQVELLGAGLLLLLLALLLLVVLQPVILLVTDIFLLAVALLEMVLRVLLAVLAVVAVMQTLAARVVQTSTDNLVEPPVPVHQLLTVVTQPLVSAVVVAVEELLLLAQPQEMVV